MVSVRHAFSRHAFSRHAFARDVLLYGMALAAIAIALQGLDVLHATRVWSDTLYGVSVALIFTVLGLWAGHRLAPRPRNGAFARNAAAAAALALSARELEVLDQLAQGAPNKVIARRLAISPNTVKTHLARLFDKLGAANRTEAIARARALDLLP